MEHRLAARQRFALDVALYARGSLYARGVCRNLGQEGAYITTEPTRFRRNALIEVEFLAPGWGRTLRLPAMVVHFCSDGVGLNFDGLSPEHAQALRQLMQQQVQARRAYRR